MNDITLNIQLLKNAKGVPEYGSAEASGLDIKAAIDSNIIIKSKEFLTVPSGIIIEIPKGFEAQVRPRSGLASKNGITVLNTPGTIDSDYRGEIKVILINLSKDDFLILPAMRIAQLVINPTYRVNLNLINKIKNKTDRGTDGFGSTGL